jgi:hypothetical protein
MPRFAAQPTVPADRCARDRWYFDACLCGALAAAERQSVGPYCLFLCEMVKPLFCAWQMANASAIRTLGGKHYRMALDSEPSLAPPISLEAGLRPIRRARLRAGCLTLSLFPISTCGMAIFFPRFWFGGLVLAGLIVGLYLLFAVADLPCPRCGQPFFGPIGEHRNALFAFRRRCWYCRLSL